MIQYASEVSDGSIEKDGIHGKRGQLSRSIAGVARQIDKLQHRAVGIVKIGARTVEHAALPVLLEGDLHTMSAQNRRAPFLF